MLYQKVHVLASYFSSVNNHCAASICILQLLIIIPALESLSTSFNLTFPAENILELGFIHESTPCSAEDLVLSIHSAVENRQKRLLLRNTWANPAILYRLTQAKVKVIFILGSTLDPQLQELVDYESEAYGDIVQGSFIDSYRNNTYKALSHFRWASGPSGCPKAKLIIKSDDDVMIQLERFKALYPQLLENRETNGPLIMMGNLFSDEVRLKPVRDPKDPWFISEDVYPDETFPPWFQGMVYVLTPRLASLMYPLTANLTYMHTDDVYVSILADRVRPNIIRIELNDLYSKVTFYEKPIRRDWLRTSKAFFHHYNSSLSLQLWHKSCQRWQGC